MSLRIGPLRNGDEKGGRSGGVGKEFRGNWRREASVEGNLRAGP